MKTQLIGRCGSLLLTLLLASCGSPQQPIPSALSFQEFQALEASIHKTGTTPTPSNCNARCEGLRQEFRYIVYVGQQIYAYWDLKRAETGTDYDALALRLEQSIVTNTTATQYLITIRNWASSFRDGHVNAMMKADLSDIEIYSAAARFEMLAPGTDHEKVIIAATSPALSLSGNVKPGDQVLAVDGIPVSQKIDELELVTAGSTRRMRRNGAARKISDLIGIENGGAPLTLTIQRAGESTTRNVSLYRTAELAVPPSSGQAAESSGIENFKALILPGNLGYLRIDAFVGSRSTVLLNQAIQRLANTRGLLIDLRKNGGGDQSGNSILSHLISSKITRYKTGASLNPFVLANRAEYHSRPHSPGALFADWKNEEVTPATGGAVYLNKPVVALISAYCFSACDTFTAALKSNHLATIVGEATGGGTGTPLVFDLPTSGHKFRYSVVRGITSDDQAIEGVGTTPDVVIEPTVEERIAGSDEQLLSSLRVLQEKIDAARPPAASPATPAPAAPAPAPTPDPTTAVLTQATDAMGQVWNQSLEVSPTIAEDRALQNLAPCDELAN